MTNGNLRFGIAVVLAGLLAIILLGCRKEEGESRPESEEPGAATPDKERAAAYEALIPKEDVPVGWELSGSVKVYPGKKLYDSIDGAADRFFQYVFREQYVATYKPKVTDKTITIEVYDMGTADDAFGIFSCHDNIMSGHTNVGLSATISEMNLDFCQGKYFARLLAAGFDGGEGEKPLRTFAETIARNIQPPAELPGLVKRLPKGYVEGTVLFFHTHKTLNERRYVAEENVLELTEKNNGVLAAYGSEERKSDDIVFKVEKDILFLIEYPNKEKAQSARTSYIKHVEKLVEDSRAPGQPEGDVLQVIGPAQEPLEIYQLYKGQGEKQHLTALVHVFRNFIFGVWEISDAERAKSLLKTVQDNLGV
jgi:hypothetical protein